MNGREIFARVSTPVVYLYAREREREKNLNLWAKTKENIELESTRMDSYIYIYIYIYRFSFFFPLPSSLEKFMTRFGAIDRLIERFFLFEKCRRMCCTPFLSSLPLGSSFVYTRFRKRVQTDKCMSFFFFFFFFLYRVIAFYNYESFVRYFY